MNNDNHVDELRLNMAHLSTNEAHKNSDLEKLRTDIDNMALDDYLGGAIPVVPGAQQPRRAPPPNRTALCHAPGASCSNPYVCSCGRYAPLPARALTGPLVPRYALPPNAAQRQAQHNAAQRRAMISAAQHQAQINAAQQLAQLRREQFIDQMARDRLHLTVENRPRAQLAIMPPSRSSAPSTFVSAPSAAAYEDDENFDKVKAVHDLRHSQPMPKVRNIFTTAPEQAPGAVLFIARPPPAAPAPQRAVRNPCVVCYEKEISQLFTPCNHVSMCGACADNIMAAGKTCPVCRAAIEKNITIFLCADSD